MLHDLTLNTTDGGFVGFAKIDISNDTQNIGTKQVSVNSFTLIPPSEDDDELEGIEAAQSVVEKFITPRNYLMQDLVDQFHAINIVVELNGDQVAFTTTTTTAATTTTTTAATTTTTTAP